MAKHELVIVADYSQESLLTLEEICLICRIKPEYIQELIQYEIIHPTSGQTSQEWVFDLIHLERIKTSLRLQHDLEVNMAGIAIVLDLLDELHDLRARMELLERHYK